MIEQQFLKPDEKLTAFVDGELSKEELGNLFYELAQNPDMQEELNQLILIKNTFRNKQIPAPDFLKSKVMAKVGLANPTFLERILSPAFYSAFFAGSWLKTASVTSVILLIGLVMLSKFDDLKNSEEQRQILLTKGNSKSSLPIVSSYSDNGIENVKSTNNSITFAGHKNVLAVNKIPKSKSQSSLQQETLEELTPSQNNDAIDSQFNRSTIDNSSQYSTNFFGLKNITHIGMLIPQTNDGLGRFLSDLSVNLRYFNGASFPSFDMANNNQPIVNNFSIGINYKISPNHYIGFAYGQENFLMKFDQQEGEIIYTYNQSFNSTWLAGTYKYVFSEIGNLNLYPELNVLLGASQVGPIAKFGGGVGFFVTDNLTLNLGSEYSLMVYPTRGDWAKGDWYSTHKFGYNIGLGVSF